MFTYRIVYRTGYEIATENRIGRHIEMPLTTLCQDTVSLGTRAGERRISLIEYPKTVPVEQVVIRGEMYPGRTVGTI